MAERDWFLSLPHIRRAIPPAGGPHRASNHAQLWVVAILAACNCGAESNLKILPTAGHNLLTTLGQSAAVAEFPPVLRKRPSSISPLTARVRGALARGNALNAGSGQPRDLIAAGPSFSMR
jgi:hypothetical protein